MTQRTPSLTSTVNPRLSRRVLCLAGLACLAGCDAPPPAPGPQYAQAPVATSQRVMRLAVHPLHNPQKLAEAYQPLIDWLNTQQVDVRFELEASRDYANYEEKFRKRESEFLLPNPWQATQAMQVGYAVIAMAGDPADFKGLLLIRKDSGIRQISDLKGQRISYPSPTALAACMMPQMYLQKHGLNVMQDTRSMYVGSQESSIMNVFLRESAVGATWPPPWRAFQRDHPREAAQLTVAWETEALVNNAVMARHDVPREVVDMVRQTLLGLHESEAGRDVLRGMETKKFLPASDSDYEVVQKFTREFENRIRKVEEKP